MDFNIIGIKFRQKYNEIGKILNQLISHNMNNEVDANSFINILNECKNQPQTRYVFLQVILNKIYLLYSLKDFKDKPLKDSLQIFFKGIEKHLIAAFPGDGHKIINFYVNNFNGFGDFRLNEIIDVKKIQENMLILHCVNIAIAFFNSK